MNIPINLTAVELPTHIGATIWENKSWKLTAINLGYHFTSLLIAAIIITKM